MNKRTHYLSLSRFARHKNDKNYNNKHSGIYYSRHLLWGDSKNLKDNIKLLEKKDKIKIKIELN